MGLSFDALQQRSADPAFDRMLSVSAALTPYFEEPQQAFVAHWKQLAAEGALVPTLQAFLDKPSPLHAPQLFIFEIENHRLRVRLQGTALVDRWGKDFTGQLLYEKASAKFREDSIANFLALVAMPCGCFMVDQLATDRGRISQAKIVLLPLSPKPGRPPLVVAYSTEIESLLWNERLTAKSVTVEAEWLDLGAGIPALPPRKPGR